MSLLKLKISPRNSKQSREPAARFTSGAGQRRKVSEVWAKIAYSLSREMGISMAEFARNLGVGTSAIAIAIRKEEPQN